MILLVCKEDVRIAALESVCYILDREKIMLNFEEELEKFQPSLEIEKAEEAICQGNSVDIIDLIHELMQEKKQ